MNEIHILPAEVRDQIAAGEVVERPSSVIKELVENSIDAGATDIEIEIEAGGKHLMKVTDNGHGMTRVNAKKCFLRHATSKISTSDDLFALHSFGFRGEALAAISSISRVTMTTKHTIEPNGTQIVIENGLLERIDDTPANGGTTIIIEDLFAPVPARRQYLKTDQTEARAIQRVVTEFALSHSNVAFTLTSNGKTNFAVPSTDEPLTRIQELFKRTQVQWLPVSFHGRGVAVTGFCGTPESAGPNRMRQYLFVNDRSVQDHKVAYAIRSAYTRTCGLEKHYHPAFVLHITVDPLLVDVNVHPRKREVKFAEPRDIFDAATLGITDALSTVAQIQPTQTSTITPTLAHSFPSSALPHLSPSRSYSHTYPPQNSPRPQQITQANTFAGSLLRSTDETPAALPTLHTNEMRVLAQSSDRFFIAENEQGLHIFDQHALHERIRFERLYRQYNAQNIPTQTLLLPITIRGTNEENSILKEHREFILSLGYTLNDAADAIISVPSSLQHLDAEQLILDLVTYLREETTGEHAIDRAIRQILERRACRGSIFFGDRVTIPEAQQIINELDETIWQRLCPHGRPSSIFWPFEALEKQFHR